MSKFVIIITRLFCKSAAKRLLNQTLECEVFEEIYKDFYMFNLSVVPGDCRRLNVKGGDFFKRRACYFGGLHVG